MTTPTTAELLVWANTMMAVATAASLLSKRIKATTVEALADVHPDHVRAAAEAMAAPVKLINDLVHIMGTAAQAHLGAQADPSKVTRSMLEALRHCLVTGDALRPAAWGPGFYLIISPRPSDASMSREDPAHRGLEHARLRNPATRADHPLDLEDMLGPWVTLPIKDAQLEAATRAADGEDVR